MSSLRSQTYSFYFYSSRTVAGCIHSEYHTGLGAESPVGICHGGSTNNSLDFVIIAFCTTILDECYYRSDLLFECKACQIDPIASAWDDGTSNQ